MLYDTPRLTSSYIADFKLGKVVLPSLPPTGGLHGTKSLSGIKENWKINNIFNTILLTQLLAGSNLKQPDLKRKTYQLILVRLPKQSFSIQQLSKFFYRDTVNLHNLQWQEEYNDRVVNINLISKFSSFGVMY